MLYNNHINFVQPIARGHFHWYFVVHQSLFDNSSHTIPPKSSVDDHEKHSSGCQAAGGTRPPESLIASFFLKIQYHLECYEGPHLVSTADII